MNNFRYRLTVVNDFQNITAFLDYKHFGEMTHFEASFVQGPKEKIDQTTGIGIFLNYNKIAFFKSKAEAVKKVQELIDNCPKEAKKDFTEYSGILFKGLI